MTADEIARDKELSPPAEWVLALRPGDSVRWNDPDPDRATNCSRTDVIKGLDFGPESVVIVWHDDGVCDAYYRELEPADSIVYCSEDDYEAVCFTALGTPLCHRCMDAYRRGQESPEAEIAMIADDAEDGDDHSNDEPFFCAVDICDCEAGYFALVDGAQVALCPMCMEDFKLGQASPGSAIYDLDQVRVRYDDGVYTITAIFDGTDWQPVVQPTVSLLAAARCALADLEGIMPEFDPDGDRTHPGWQTIKDLRAAIAGAKEGE